MKQFIAIILFSFIFNASIAQYKSAWQAGMFYSKFLSHQEKRVAPEQNQFGFTFDFTQQTNGKKYWQFAHKFPQKGLSFTYRNLGNERVYGSVYSLIPFLEFDFIKGKRGSIQLKHGTGLAYVSKRYDPVSNPLNTLLSTRIMASSILDAGYRYKIAPRVDTRFVISLQHYSNGGFRLPNAGMNIGSVYAGISYYPMGREEVKTSHLKIMDFKRWRYRVGTAFGFYNYKPAEPSIEINTQLTALAYYQHNTGFRTGLGLEADQLSKEGQLAIYAEEEIQFGNVTTRYGFGGYVVNKLVPGQDFYTKIGIAYFPKMSNKIPVNFYVGSMLKAHLTKAAHVELSVGYVF